MQHFKEQILQRLETNLKFYFSEALNAPLAKPNWVYISLTHQCNFNCQMCGVKGILKGYELDSSTIKKIFLEIAAWDSDTVVVLTGGEAFLRDDIFEIIGSAVSQGLQTEIVSNGSMIDNPQISARIIRSGLQNMAISLDGARPETHDYIRGHKGAYQKAMRAFSLLCQEKQKHKTGPQISAWTTIMKENVSELYDMIPLTKGIGVECLVYHPVIVTQDDMQNTSLEGKFWIHSSQLKDLNAQIDKIVSYQKENGFVAFLHDPHLWIDYFKGSLTKNDWKCNPFVFIDIGPDGNVRSCGAPFGNINEMTLTECLTTAEAQRARERMAACNKPCLQTCWARPEADSLSGIARTAIASIDGLKCARGEKAQLVRDALDLINRYEQFVMARE